MAVDFDAVQTRLVELLRAEMPSARQVFDGEPGDLTAASPVVVVWRRGRRRPRLTLCGSETFARFWVDTYVVAAKGKLNYLPVHVKQQLNITAQEFDACMDAHQTDEIGGWQAVEYEGESEIGFGMFNGDGIPRFSEHLCITLRIYA